jgi:hypothetical protein
MRTAFPLCLNRWKTLYRAAILETNKAILPQRVSEAEEAVKTRGREIFYGKGTAEEEEALDDALYALHAFRTAWQHSEAVDCISHGNELKVILYEHTISHFTR